MFTLQRQMDLPVPVGEVFEFHMDVRNLPRVSPPFIPTKLVSIPMRPILGSHIDLRARLGPIWFDWRFEVSELRQNERFTVRQTRGPFAFWEHIHEFESAGDGTRLTDTIRYELPGRGAFARVVAPAVIHRHIRQTLRHRQRKTLALLTQAGR